MSYFLNDGTVNKETHKFDINGNDIEYGSYINGTLEKKCESEYDSKGNYIKSTEFRIGKPKSITNRTIEYY
jgi:hypothetical protein